MRYISACMRHFYSCCGQIQLIEIYFERGGLQGKWRPGRDKHFNSFYHCDICYERFNEIIQWVNDLKGGEGTCYLSNLFWVMKKAD